MIVYTLEQGELAISHVPQLERIVTDAIYVIETEADYESLSAFNQSLLEWRTL